MDTKYLGFSIDIAGSVYTKEDLLIGNYPSHPALDFCADWFNGKDAFQLQTSGSTGKPKRLTIHRSQMRASAVATIETLALPAQLCALVCINTNYIGGKMMLVRGMIGEWQLTLVEPSLNPLNQISVETVFDFTALVPLQLHTILEKAPEKIPILNQMQAIIVGGAAIGLQLQQKLQIVKAPIYSTYGMTETVSHIALKRMNGVEQSAYFQVLNGVEINTDKRNCLTIKAPVTEGKLLVTNDLVDIVSTNQFEWLGRYDYVINTGGIKIPLEQIEAKIGHVLVRLSLDLQFAIVPLPDEKLGQRIALVLEGIAQEHEVVLFQAIKAKLTKYECPKSIKWIKKIPETASGKIDRQQLLAEFT